MTDPHGYDRLLAQIGERLRAAAPPPRPTPGDVELWTDLCELPDRTSPPDYPDHALITQAEFCGYLATARAAAIEQIAQLAEERGRIWVKEGVRLGIGQQSNPFPRFAKEIRATFGQSTAAPSSSSESS